MVAAGLIASVLIWLWFIRRYDRFEPEPLGAIIVVLIFGGVISFLSVFFLSYLYPYITLGSDLVRALVVGFNEEFFKLFATVLLIHKMKDLNEPIDALIYSMAVALGFAALENALYVSRLGGGVILVRSLMPVPGHLAFAGIWGYGLAVYYFKPKGKSLALTVLPYYVAGSIAHAAYDYPLFADYMSVYSTIVVLIIVCVLAHLSLKELLKESQFATFGVCAKCSPGDKKPARENVFMSKNKYSFCENCGKVYLHFEDQ